MVVVDAVRLGAADDLADALAHPLAAGIGVAAGELHRRDVALADLARLVDHRRRNVHAVLAAGGLQVAGRARMAEAARAEMDADPDQPLLVAQQVDIVVARADRAELRRRLRPIVLAVRHAPGFGIVEQLMLGRARHWCGRSRTR